MPSRSSLPILGESIVSLFVDLWKPWSDIVVEGLSLRLNAEGLRAVIDSRIEILLIDNINLGTRPAYFNTIIVKNFLDVQNSSSNSLHSYFESQLFFIIAKYCFIKSKNEYAKDDLANDIDSFYEATKSSVETKFMYTVSWFSDYSSNKTSFTEKIDSLINNRSDEVVSIVNSYMTFDTVDDLFFFLSDKNTTDNSMNKIYAQSLGNDPFLSDDEALVFEANEIINDISFSLSLKTLPSYGVLNALKQPTNISTFAFYNFYSSDESVPGKGDKIVDSSNYYDAAAGFKSMPRYVKLKWNPITGGAGIDFQIVPVSGNISNISQLQVANELYFSQEFRKNTNDISFAPLSSMFLTTPTSTASATPDMMLSIPHLRNYMTICSSSMEKFSSSKFWSKITKTLIGKDTKDIIDNKIFVTDHSLIRKRTEEEPRLQYVGYIITKYELSDKWKLKEVIMLDDCSTSIYYDFNVLYNKKYRYKIASLIKWVYSTSLSEVESFYSDAPAEPDISPSVSLTPAVSLIPIFFEPPIVKVALPSSTGYSIMGSDSDFEHRVALIDGGISHIDEDSRALSRDPLSETVASIGSGIATSLKKSTQLTGGPSASPAPRPTWR